MAEQNREEPKSGLEANVGKVVAINCNSGQFLGVLQSISYSLGEVYLLPSVVFEADGKRMKLEGARPTVVSLGNFKDGKDYAIRPLDEKYLEDIVRLSRKEIGLFGFGSS
jgi:hypothetical protein